MVSVNPHGLSKAFPLFCDAVAQWRRPSPALAEMFRTVLHAFRNAMGPQWPAYYAGFPPNLRQKLEVYQL